MVADRLEPIDENVGPVLSTTVRVLAEAAEALQEHYPLWSAVLFSFANLINEELPE